MTKNHLVANTKGFTIIEMLVSLALFTIVATVATGALLSLIGNNQRLVGEQNAMTTLSFALDSMTREIRTGSEYRCGTSAGIQSGSFDATAVLDCANGTGLSFREGGESITKGNDNNRIAYYIDGDYYGTGIGAIMRKVGSATCPADYSATQNSGCVPLTPDNIDVDQMRFYVTDSKPLNNRSGTINMVQPTATIIIVADPVDDESDKEYTVQTTVTQRALDI